MRPYASEDTSPFDLYDALAGFNDELTASRDSLSCFSQRLTLFFLRASDPVRYVSHKAGTRSHQWTVHSPGFAHERKEGELG